MKKAPQAFRTISEVSDWLDTPTHVLRFWESKFSQIKPVKRAGGRRYYRPADMKLLGGIKTLLHGEGITIKAAQKILSDKGVKHVSELSPELDFPEKGRRTKSAKTAPAPTKDKEESVADTSTPPAPSTPTHDETPVFTSSHSAQPAPASPDIKHPVEQDAKDRINAAVGRREEPIVLTESVPVADAQSLVERKRHAISPTKTRATLNDDQMMDVEDLFYRLKKVRNRMKRALNQLS
ncbi:MerR family transcriptional regulator [Paramylibacter kogurei]|uniref:MerR family transcriptional regulator n=1 Tax=Paramylibacter kogurei TaxID=1889778 RepID=UPI000C14AB51|nr:MerR family transcriptional regulator [Amylibacter kogurei]